VNDTAPSQDTPCTMCDGMLASLDELEAQIARIRGMLADQNASAACPLDQWKVYDGLDLNGRGDVGRVRISDFSDIDAIKAHVLGQGHNVFVLAGDWAYIKSFNYAPQRQEMDGCDRCQIFVYDP